MLPAPPRPVYSAGCAAAGEPSGGGLGSAVMLARPPRPVECLRVRVSLRSGGTEREAHLPSGLIARAWRSSASSAAAPGWRLPAPPRPEEWRGPTDAERERERLLEGETAALPAPPRPYVRWV